MRHPHIVDEKALRRGNVKMFRPINNEQNIQFIVRNRSSQSEHYVFTVVILYVLTWFLRRTL